MRQAPTSILSWPLRLVRGAAWLSLMVIVIASVVQGAYRPGTGAPGEFDHAIAYAGAGFLFVIGYSRLTLTVILLALMAGLLEVAQHYSSGRHPALLDWAAGSGGAMVGSIAGWIVVTTTRSLQAPDRADRSQTVNIGKRTRI